MASINYLNRRRWAIDQRKKARAENIARDIAERAEKEAKRLTHLRKLAVALADHPNMAITLDAVQAEIAVLERQHP